MVAELNSSRNLLLTETTGFAVGCSFPLIKAKTKGKAKQNSSAATIPPQIFPQLQLPNQASLTPRQCSRSIKRCRETLSYD